MKSVYLRSCVAIACALSLAACGGSKGSLVLGGSVTGLTKEGLTVQNNGGPELKIPAGFTTFQFVDLIAQDTAFNVTIKDQPPGATCSIANNKGVATAYNVTNIAINCVTFSFYLGGTITGYTGGGLIISNGADILAVPANATSFKMPEKITDSFPYGLAINQQPANGKVCSIINGAGRMGQSDKNDVQIVCQ